MNEEGVMSPPVEPIGLLHKLSSTCRKLVEKSLWILRYLKSFQPKKSYELLQDKKERFYIVNYTLETL